MAELTIVAASVAPGSDVSKNKDFLAGETITAGMLVYHLASDTKWYMVKNSGTAVQSGSGALIGSGGVAVAAHASLAGQPLCVYNGGSYTVGATILVGVHYFSGPTFGLIGLAVDIASGKLMTRVGYGLTTTVMQLDLRATGLVVA